MTIGNTASALKLADGEITGLVTNKIDSDTDAVNVEYLKDYVSKNGTGKTYTAGNGIAIDEAGNNKISVKTAADGNLEVGSNGVALKDDISLTSVRTSGAVTVGGTLGVTGATTLGSTLNVTGATTLGALTTNGTATFSQGASMNDQKITGVAKGTADTDAVNVKQLADAIATVDGETYTAGDGIAIDQGSNNAISVKTAQDGNLEVGSNGVALKDDISLTSVTTSRAVTVGGDLGVTGTTTLTGALTANGAATFTQGASMNNQKITGVLAGKEGTDAVNKSQLDAVQSQIKTYTAGKGVAIDGSNVVSVKNGNGIGFDASGKVEVKAAQNGNIVVNTNGVSLSKTVSGLTSLGTDALTVNNNATVGGTLGVTGALTAASVTAAGGFTINDSNSLTSSGLTIDGTKYITSDGLSAGGKVITGVANGVNDYDAVNMSQLNDVKEVSDLAVTYTNATKSRIELAGASGTTITNVADGTLSASSTEAVNGKQLYTVDEKVGDASWSRTNHLDTATDLTDAADALDGAIGSITFDGTNFLNSSYSDLTSAVSALDRGIGNLTFSGQNVLSSTKMTSVTSALTVIDNAIGPMEFRTTNFLKNQTSLSGAVDKLDMSFAAALNAIGVRTDGDGNVSTTIDWSNFNYISNGSVIDGMRILDGEISSLNGRVMKLETASNALSTFSTSNISTLSALSNMDMSAVNTLSSLSADDLAAISTLSEDGSVPAANSDPNSRPGRGPSSGSEDSSTHDGNTQVMDHNLAVTGNVSVGGTLDVTGKATFGSDVSVGGNLDVQGETNMHGTLNMNDNKITGVKDGDISADSTDAVNGSQLWQTNQQVAANTENIGILGSAVNKLGDRIERVGAGAAALAALHPLDFDPDNKLDFAAGFGNYRGASAVAVGAFYRPSENVMFSVGGAFGGGEDMVNAGVSFKVGAGSGSATTSRTAMAKSLKSMQEVVASQDAQLAQQREQIDKLTAMVELLMEQNGQAQPKDGDAQAAQPQQ